MDGRHLKREVGAELEVEIIEATTLEFQIAVAPHPNAEVSEQLSFVLDGKPVQPLEISGMHGNRIHKLEVPAGYLTADYAATIVGRTDPPPVTEADLSIYLRPSRYAEADKLYGFAATEFGRYVDSSTLLERVSLWVGTRLSYVPGSSRPIDGAVDTLLLRQGVCRDVFGDDRSRGDIGAVPDLHGRDKSGVGSDEDPPADRRWVLFHAIVIAGNCPGSDVGSAADVRVAKVAEMHGLGAFSQDGVLEFDEIADMRAIEHAHGGA